MIWFYYFFLALDFYISKIQPGKAIFCFYVTVTYKNAGIMQESDFLHDLGQTLRYSHKFANITQHKIASIYGGCALTMARMRGFTPMAKLIHLPVPKSGKSFS
jgi:hypothetical protein